MLVFSEDSPRLTRSASAQSLKSATETALIAGCDIRYIPQQEICPSAADALDYVPIQSEEVPGVWLGYIPAANWYREIYEEALKKRIRLLNTPDEHLNAQEFDRAYAFIQELTPESVILVEESQCARAIERLGLPIFVKGTIQSRKASGWKSCIAETPEEFIRLCRELLAIDSRSRGRVVARRFVPLRHSRTSGQGFPLGREYRIFLFRQEVLGWGYYWEGEDPLKALTVAETQAVLELAKEAARRIGAPFLAVDIGQTAQGDWIVIETGDAQFSGTSQAPLLPLWYAISNIKLGHANTL